MDRKVHDQGSTPLPPELEALKGALLLVAAAAGLVWALAAPGGRQHGYDDHELDSTPDAPKFAS
jgi:hypothetical protein